MHSYPCKIIACFTYLTFTWSASKVSGPSDVYPRYGDISGAWTPKPRTRNDFEMALKVVENDFEMA